MERDRRPGKTETEGAGSKYSNILLLSYHYLIYGTVEGRQDTTHRVRQTGAQFANQRGPIPWDLLDSRSTQTDTATSQQPSDTAAPRVRMDDVPSVHWGPRSAWHSTHQFQQSSPFTDVPLENVQPGEICLFCFVSYHNELERKIVHLKCDQRHMFHRECIRSWVDERRSCPACRAPM